jgi:hypothetical protein
MNPNLYMPPRNFKADGSVPLTGPLNFAGHGATDVGVLDFQEATERTIAAGVITVAQAVHKIDTEADAASDDLDTINGFTADGLLVIRRENSGRAVVLKHNTGNILIPGGGDLSIPANGFVVLVYDASASKWRANVGSLGVQAASAVAITGGTIAGVTITGATALDFAAAAELTIAAGVVTATQALHRIDTEADAASDDLDTINGGTAGKQLVLWRENSARAVVLTTAGNIAIPGTVSFTIPANGFAHLVYDGTLTKWRLLNEPVSAFIRTLIDDIDAPTARNTLGLGTIATQAANNVSITGGSIATLTTFNTSGSAGIGGTAGSGRLKLTNGFNSSVGQLECLRNDGADNFLGIFGTGTSMLFGVGAVASGSASTDAVIRGNGNNLHLSGGATIRATFPAAGGLMLGTTTAPTNGAKALTLHDNGATNPTPPTGGTCLFTKDVSGTKEGFWVDEGGTATQQTGHHDPERAKAAGIVIDADDRFPRVGYETNCYLGLEAFTYTSPTTGITQRKVRDLPAADKRDWTDDQIMHCRDCETRRAQWQADKAAWDDWQQRERQRSIAARHQWDERRVAAWKRGEPIAEPEPPEHVVEPYPSEQPPEHAPVEPPKWLRDRGVRFDRQKYNAAKGTA